MRAPVRFGKLGDVGSHARSKHGGGTWKSTTHLEEHNGHRIIQDALAEDERVQLRIDAHLAQHRYCRHCVCCREQGAEQQPFLRRHAVA